MTNDSTRALESAREPRERLWSAVDALHAAARSPSVGRFAAWRDGVTARLGEVAAAWDQHVRVAEADDGLFAEILDRAPRLEHAIERLQREHAELRAHITSVAGAVADASEGPEGAEHARDAVVMLAAQLSLHRHRGIDLVYEAYDVDISAGD